MDSQYQNVTLGNIEKLSIAERLIIVDEIWESIGSSDETLPVPDWQGQIIKERLEEDNENPADVIQWEVLRTELDI